MTKTLQSIGGVAVAIVTGAVHLAQRRPNIQDHPRSAGRDRHDRLDCSAHQTGQRQRLVAADRAKKVPNRLGFVGRGWFHRCRYGRTCESWTMKRGFKATPPARGKPKPREASNCLRRAIAVCVRGGEAARQASVTVTASP
jgi:hypothetical protein